MRLSNSLVVTTLVLSFVFGLLFVGFTLQYVFSVEGASVYLEESKPAFVAIEHLLETINKDFVLVESYLLTTKYEDLEEFENLLAQSQEQCEIITDEVDDLIVLDQLQNEQAIRSYETGVVVYESLQRRRNQLVDLHKNFLATGVMNKKDMRETREKYIELLQNATGYYTESIRLLNDEHRILQHEISVKSRNMKIVLLVLFILFVGCSAFGTYFLKKGISKPLSSMIKTSREFTSGNHEARLEVSSPIPEVKALGDQLNRVYNAIEGANKPEQKKIYDKMLAPQYADILDYVKAQSDLGRTITIKDLKKQFDLTHPTIRERVNYLENNGYIVSKKQGRNKLIFARI